MSLGSEVFKLSVEIAAMDHLTKPLRTMVQGMQSTDKEFKNLEKAMKNMGSAFTGDVNKIMGDLRRLENQKYLKSMEKDLRAVGLKSKDIDNLAASFDNLYQKQKKAQDALSRIDRGKSTLQKAGMSAITTAAMGTGIYKMAQNAGDLQMMQIQYGGVFGQDKNNADVQNMVARSKDLSTQTLFSQKEIMGINLELAHAGVNQKNIADVLKPATYLSEMAVGMGKSDSPEQTSYNFARMVDDARISDKVDRMSKFADDLYKVINVTHATDQSISETFKYSMPVTRNLGWNEQDNLMATAMAARSGIEGSMAGTHIKDFAERINPFKYIGTKGGTKQLEAMVDAGLISGIHGHQNKNGTMEITGIDSAALLKDKDHLKSYSDMVGVLSQKHADFLKKYHGGTTYTKALDSDTLKNIQEAAKTMTGKELTGGELEWAALMNKIWGEQGQDIAIITSQLESYQKVMKQVQQQKPLENAIGQVRDSFKGQAHIFTSNVGNIFLDIGTRIMDDLTPALKIANQALGKFMDFMKNHPYIDKFIGDVALIATGVMGIRTGLLLVKGASDILGGGLLSLAGKWGVVQTAAADAALAEEGAVASGGKFAGIVGTLKNLGVIAIAADGSFQLAKYLSDNVINPALAEHQKAYAKQQADSAKVTNKILGGSNAPISKQKPVFSGGSIQAPQEGFWGSLWNQVKPHAAGGIFNQPHLGLLAEAGPEAYIPLSNRKRGLQVWQQAGEALGVGSGGEAPVIINIYAQPNHDERRIAMEAAKLFGKQARGMNMNTGMRINVGSV